MLGGMLGGLEDLYFLAVFLVFNVFLIGMVEGVVAKAWFIAWVSCILVGAYYFWRCERKKD